MCRLPPSDKKLEGEGEHTFGTPSPVNRTRVRPAVLRIPLDRWTGSRWTGSRWTGSRWTGSRWTAGPLDRWTAGPGRPDAFTL